MRPPPVNKADRTAHIKELLAMPLLSLADLALLLDISIATLDKMRAEGTAPRMFRIGKRLYSTQEDFRAWVQEMAKTEA